MENREMTEEQIQNWRKILSGMVGPYAFIMPVKEIEALRDKLEAKANEDAFGCQISQEAGDLCTVEHAKLDCSKYQVCQKWEKQREADNLASMDKKERLDKWMRDHFDIKPGK